MSDRRRLIAATTGVAVVFVLAAWSVWPAGAAPLTPAQVSQGWRATCTTDSSGFCTVAHPAGVVPDAVVVTPDLPAIVSVDRASLTATTFRVRFCRTVSSTGACTALTGSRSFFVHVDWTPAAPSPSPSSASPSPGVSASASPSPSPSPTGPPPPAAWPDASTTGVPAGTVLTVVNGDVTLSTAGQAYDAREVNGCIHVTAPGVTISRTKVHCGGSSAVGFFDAGQTVDPGAGRLTVSDSEIDCLDTAGRTALGDTAITATRLNIHGCENGADVDQFVTITDSYIHDLANTSASHTDGIQLAHYLISCPPCTEVTHARNVLVQHNRIYGTGAQGAGTSALISNPAGDTDITIRDNLLGGGAYTLYCPRPGAGTRFAVLDNRWDRAVPAAFGPWTDCQDEASVSGNVFWPDGAPLP